MTYDLTKFDLGDMLACSLRLREAASGAASLEASAHRTCRFLYDELLGPDARRACALVRCYKTHPFGTLEPDLQNFARGVLGEETPRASMKCLTLMATVGQSAAWNSRQLSRNHRTIPLPSPEIVEKAPMISQLIKELGVKLSTVLKPSPEIVKDWPASVMAFSTSRTLSEARTSRRRRSSSFGMASDRYSVSADCSSTASCSRSFCSRPCMYRHPQPTDLGRSPSM